MIRRTTAAFKNQRLAAVCNGRRSAATIHTVLDQKFQLHRSLPRPVRPWNPHRLLLKARLLSGGTRQASSFHTPDMNSHDHQDCICQDPNARLTNTTLETLVELTSNINPLEMTPEEIDEKAVFLLSYLKASDVPAREKGCCSHMLGHYHAHFALCSLLKILSLVRPEHESKFTNRLVEAWPDLFKWLEYNFLNWVISPMFSEIGNRHYTFQTIVVSFRSLVKIPAICERILAVDSRMVFIILGSCWFYELEGELKTHYDPFLSAVVPLLDLATFQPGSLPDFFFACIMRPGGKPARNALDHLGWYLENPAPWDLPTLFMLDYHIRMACKMALALPYMHMLLAQHSVRTIVRILVSLTAEPYDETTAPGVAMAISSCLEYLALSLPAADGFAWTTYAVQIGLLPAMLRAQTWLPDADTQSALVKLMRLLSLYSMYPSLLRHLARSVRRENPPVWTAYLELEQIVKDRSKLRMFADIDMEVRCNNSSCRKIDDGNNFSSCSGCFTVSYCSPECQKEHWTNSHKAECEALKHLRAEGKALPMSPEDYDFATKLVFEEVGCRKDEIVRVWREEMPARTPVVSLNYFSDEPRGVLIAGSPSKYPPEGYLELLDVRELWENVISQDIHKEHIIVGVYLPHGSGGCLHFLWLGIDPRLENDESLSVVEKLIRTVEMMPP
ncbi:MYND-type domain-containing protein [Mycena sanguinolenta]|uniref:MYND-type domain-containing protein n=1 Tax=Mycena sanguinolenta TaxID=230812 RepID=A0A8H7DC59_9AGAR|nr:MYND-type domain-containing protein [Mycena sanguinolenta]